MTTATVETLTAEVRVLKVGNRQITKSVYLQLDSMPPSDEFHPFGRVRAAAISIPSSIERRVMYHCRPRTIEFVGKAGLR